MSIGFLPTKIPLKTSKGSRVSRINKEGKLNLTMDSIFDRDSSNITTVRQPLSQLSNRNVTKTHRDEYNMSKSLENF